MPAQLKAHFQVLTPMFLGGADKKPELRAASIKGALRAWYRTIDPHCNQPYSNTSVSHENHFFGGQKKGVGQSPFLITLDSSEGKRYDWQKPRRGSGIGYLGFPFSMESNARSAIQPGTEFSLSLRFPRGVDNVDLRRSVCASLWCLGHIGALGSRNRRGFGALALTHWEAEGHDWPELNELDKLSESINANQWLASFEQISKKVFREQWFGHFPEGTPQPHFGSAFSIWLPDKQCKQWQDVLEYMGSSLQEFRSGKQPDRDNVKHYVKSMQRLSTSPERAVFGLPLTFRFKDLNGKSADFVPIDPQQRTTLDRHGSLLLLRPILIGEYLYPLYLRMDGDLPGYNPPAGVRSENRGLAPPKGNAMDDFMAWLIGRNDK